MTGLFKLVKYLHFIHNINGKSVARVYSDRNRFIHQRLINTFTLGFFMVENLERLSRDARKTVFGFFGPCATNQAVKAQKVAIG